MKLTTLTSLVALASAATMATASVESSSSSSSGRSFGMKPRQHGSMMRRLKDSVLGGDFTNATAEAASSSSEEEIHLSKRATPGRATFYDVGLGACGEYNSANQNVVALNIAQYGDSSSVSKYCFKNIKITYQGKTETAQIVDCCPSCPYGALDMSKGLFGSLADFSLGVFQMSWSFIDGEDDDDDEESSKTTSTTHRTTSQYTPSSTTKQRVKATPTSTSTSTRTSTTTSTPSSTSTSTTSSSSSASTAILVLASSTESGTATASTDSASSTSTDTSSQPDNLQGLKQIINGIMGIAQDAHQ